MVLKVIILESLNTLVFKSQAYQGLNDRYIFPRFVYGYVIYFIQCQGIYFLILLWCLKAIGCIR
ncbi:hypothetical protein BHG07_13205 [Brenneria salicis ATCC 15712 = DSM 30166]|nr:hypothetical protein BHG07_13205 [Brenneria salicis ATCC 15712 = DSM 30166]